MFMTSPCTVFNIIFNSWFKSVLNMILIAGNVITTKGWHCWQNQDGGHPQKAVLLWPGLCYLWRYLLISVLVNTVMKVFSYHPVMLFRCERPVRLRSRGLCPEEQHPAGLEAALHPGGADPGDRLHNAYPRARPQVGAPKLRQGD